MSVVNQLCYRSPGLMVDVSRLRALLLARGLGIEATWEASLENVHADLLSREPDSTGWVLPPVAVARLMTAWGPLTVDRFASTLSTKLPRFNAARAGPGVEAVDAYAQVWGGELNYCAPLFAQVAATLRKCYVEAASAVCILPAWPAQPWWRQAVCRAHAVVELPTWAVAFLPQVSSPPAAVASRRTVAALFRDGGRRHTAPDGAGLPPIAS
eukprot:TRINITY_DN3114_c0_g1_i1.p2 TRINITY_DN3114_c0_g1~~TRINITY_DN3114_c0_g1_i1.p2  ORF type:complete len:212 (-),score=27.77 TRINITY_DN3114_c0_g1_i1:1485-2120(-)